MSASKLRRQIAWEAARLMYSREVPEYYVAKQKAARRCCRGWVKPADLPTNAEIQQQVQMLARLQEGPETNRNQLLKMRLKAAWWMRLLSAYHPKLIGSVLKGTIREGSDIDLHVYAANPHRITVELDDLGIGYELERKRVVKAGESRVFTHIHVEDEFPVELTVYHPSLLGFRFRSSLTQRPIEQAGLADLEKKIALEHGMDPTQQAAELNEIDTQPDRFYVFESLLFPLENVKQNSHYHPEGDALYHSLQVYELAREAMPYDEEFLLAALLHDIGKAIDPQDHVGAALEALDGFIAERTAWLIRHHMEAHKLHDRTIGARRRRRLAAHPWFDDLQIFGECDRGGRDPRAQVDSVEAALDYIQSLT